jgi:hypothetical protein
MNKAVLFFLLVSGVLRPQFLVPQEAESGVDLRATLSGQVAASSVSTEPPTSGSAISAGFRSVFYPTWKLSDHWTITGALQFYSRPYFFADFSTPGYGAKGDILQATLGYSRVSDKGSILIRAGQLSTAFGSFLLHYEDADNALVDLTLEYGYYDAVNWTSRSRSSTGWRKMLVRTWLQSKSPTPTKGWGMGQFSWFSSF